MRGGPLIVCAVRVERGARVRHLLDDGVLLPAAHRHGARLLQDLPRRQRARQAKPPQRSEQHLLLLQFKS